MSGAMMHRPSGFQRRRCWRGVEGTVIMLSVIAGCVAEGKRPPEARVAVTLPQERAALARELQQQSRHWEGLKTLIDTRFDRGTRDVELLLDVVCPESTAVPADAGAETARLVQELSSEDYAEVRHATLGLYAIGPGMRAVLQQEVEKSTDPLRTILLQGIIAAWKLGVLEDQGDNRVTRLIAERIVQVKDMATITALQKRAVRLLAQGVPGDAGQTIVRAIAQACARTRDDDIIAGFRPLLSHADASVAGFTVEAIGSGRESEFFPSLLIEALRSDREPVVDAAINWATNCWDPARSESVHEALRAIFRGDNELLKFHSCFALMHGYGDPEAVSYLLSQIGSSDRNRSLRAISWIGDTCNLGKPVSPELLERLVPLLRSNDNEVRREAGSALGAYSGEEVMQKVIPLLGDSEAIIVAEVGRRLLDQRDKSRLRALLQQAGDQTENAAVAAKAKELLGKLDAR